MAAEEEDTVFGRVDIEANSKQFRNDVDKITHNTQMRAADGCIIKGAHLMGEVISDSIDCKSEEY